MSVSQDDLDKLHMETEQEEQEQQAASSSEDEDNDDNEERRHKKKKNKKDKKKKDKKKKKNKDKKRKRDEESESEQEDDDDQDEDVDEEKRKKKKTDKKNKHKKAKTDDATSGDEEEEKEDVDDDPIPVTTVKYDSVQSTSSTSNVNKKSVANTWKRVDGVEGCPRHGECLSSWNSDEKMYMIRSDVSNVKKALSLPIDWTKVRRDELLWIELVGDDSKKPAVFAVPTERETVVWCDDNRFHAVTTKGWDTILTTEKRDKKYRRQLVAEVREKSNLITINKNKGSANGGGVAAFRMAEAAVRRLKSKGPDCLDDGDEEEGKVAPATTGTTTGAGAGTKRGAGSKSTAAVKDEETFIDRIFCQQVQHMIATHLDPMCRSAHHHGMSPSQRLERWLEDTEGTYKAAYCSPNPTEVYHKSLLNVMSRKKNSEEQTDFMMSTLTRLYILISSRGRVEIDKLTEKYRAEEDFKIKHPQGQTIDFEANL